MGFVTRLFNSVFGGVSTSTIKSAPPPLTISGAPITPPVTPAQATPAISDPNAVAGAEVARQRAAAAAGAGFSGTIASTPQGVVGAPMAASKTLLGS